MHGEISASDSNNTTWRIMASAPLYSGILGAIRVQPASVAIGILLALPDWHPLLDLVDDETARGEGGIAMRRADADPHRQLADRQVADAMHAVRIEDVELRECLAQDALALGFRQRDISLVAQPANGAAFVMVADPAFEAGVAAHPVIQQARAQRAGVEGRIGQREMF